MLSLSALGIPLGFAFPWALAALLSLPIIWWLLRLTPPRPAVEPFPPTRIVAELLSREETPARSPWWLTLLRLLMATLIILAMALPVWNPQNPTLKSGEGPVLLIIDNGWASGNDWDERLASASAIVEEALAANRQIIAIATVQNTARKIELSTAQDLKNNLPSWKNFPVRPDYNLLATDIKQAVDRFSPGSIVFLSNGIAGEGSIALGEILQQQSAQKILYLPQPVRTIVINSVKNLPDAMQGELLRADASGPAVANIIALDLNGVSVARQIVSFNDGEKSKNFRFEIPVELRNDIVRVTVEGMENAGAVQLLDENNRRRLVGLVSGAKHDNSQPLLSPLYYISRALEPFSDIRRASDANVAKAVPELITRGVSTIVLADVGTLASPTAKELLTWVERGGMLIRFAGPRLAASSNEALLPVRLRRGDRNLGGALSWEEPKPVAEFEVTSPFFGLEPPQEVFVSRQVLAIQEAELAQRTWARLSDGTPLVTAARQGDGWVVLFHVSSDAGWSNLPISGTFVEMLRRIVNQSRASLGIAATAQKRNLPPLRLLDGKGRLTAPDVQAKPLIFAGGNDAALEPVVSLENPPGFYGTVDGFRALNLFNSSTGLDSFSQDIMGAGSTLSAYGEQRSLSLKSWALALLALLLVLDCLAVLWMAGQLGFLKPKSLPAAAASVFIAAALVLSFSVSSPTFAQNAPENTPDEIIAEDFDFSPALRTRLAYVITGIADVDEASEAGLRGLTRFLTQRTAIEPGEPIGVDISSDELAFYPLIYWPIDTASELPDAPTMARIDAYMKQGGSVLFDTRDQISGFLGGSSASPQAIHLQQILSSLDIPPLEPVPEDHVLTKSFFILAQFPGRFTGGELWVEQLPEQKPGVRRPARGGDGVSSILITSNDLAGAWAIDSQSRPMFPIVPPNPFQRELAFRVGVNLIMYAMTGNYKSDQVHIPALLERLGQ